ncbi:hypothetical protein [Nocardiopsis synnemataformans]|uniref:hypothetical protein n=1 Tax=Nocardiopsis synnemataformans TaxID=61305 RepID=UPI003EB6AD38
MTARARVYGTVKNAFTGHGALARVGFAVFVAATITTQHHHVATYNRVKVFDRFQALPTWRFFAPEPGVHDYLFLYRTIGQEGEISTWNGIDLARKRSLGQMFWFPSRRGEKAFFDASVELVGVIDRGFDVISLTPAYRLLDNYVRARIRAENPEADGYQIAMVKSSGFDSSEAPEMVMLTPRRKFT